ncbi:glycoside hydrolase family 3 N-terminal domain-containing protein [Amycolatopsis sp. H20-H5]|uniref:glycoside hydrolase family 3 N-terminal domain-containing protein n=1 Tax=Amycolatopsis sp. H20-H5 TaxID=3046309 RepID=UPI002DBDF6BA|nr:glycoside hydrolase family 3 N-terminal domain-containing protein [Amycolatopsis sp. H20-H5]MEC3979195.1 glycoside hydrolase family 3 N-terminal domain-containing protein [Amycolatopsis sp. H20-H5]
MNRRSLLAGFGGLLAAGGVASTGLLTAPAAADPAAPPKRDERVEALLRKMTLAEKLGQLQLVGDETAARTSLATGQLGGVFSVVGAAKLNALQHLAVERTRLRIPLIFGLDVIHGYTTNFPIPLAQGSSFDPTVAGTDASVSAQEARRSGIHWTYAPMMDVTHEPRWGRIAEGYGEDPYLATKLAVSKVRGYQGDDFSSPDRLAACAKHFVAYGGAEGGRDYNTVDVSVQRLHNHYLPPFKACVEAGVATVMASFNTISGSPAHGNGYVLHEILKGGYGFPGFVVSDYTSIQELILHGLAADGADAATAGLSAGVDMEMVSTNYVRFGQRLLAERRITRDEIDDAVRRILLVKFKLGLFERPYTDESGEVKMPSAAALDKSRQAAGRCMVLLKNDAQTLPLAKSVGSVAVVGPLGTATYDLNGTWSGLGTGAGTTPPVTVVDGIKAAAPGAKVTFTAGCTVDGTGTGGFAAAQQAARAADVTVVVVGETAAMSGEAAARSVIDLPGVQQQLVAAIKETGKPFVVVLINGRPLTIPYLHENAPAILEAWAPGVQGGHAIADVLFAVVNPGGKLPVSFPRAVGQIPIYYNHENTGRPADPGNKYTSKYLDLESGPLYEFGHGLSYTTFRIDGLRLSDTRMSLRGGKIQVSVQVTNTGGRAGDEVVQLFLRDPVATIVQPVRRLRGFERVTLAAGESRTVSFTLTTEDVGFYDNAATFRVEPGKIEVYVGNSASAALTSSFTVG